MTSLCKKWKQIFAGCVASLGAACTGVALAFPSSALPQMLKPDADFPVTESEASWIAGILTGFAPMGNIIAGLLTDRLGRRRLLIFSGLPILCGFILSAVAPFPLILIAGRGVIGIAVGVSYVSGAVYISETAEPAIRGIIAAFMNLLSSLGSLFEFLTGTLTSDWRTLSWINLITPIMFILLAWILPESPRFLLQQNKEELAMNSLKRLREKDHDSKEELRKIKDHLLSKDNKEFSLKMLLSKQNIVLIVYAAILGILFSCTGGFTTIIFAEPLSTKFHSSVNSGLLSIILAVTQLMGIFLSLTVVDRIGRRRLLQLSGFGMFLTCISLSLYDYLTAPRENPSYALGYLPAILLVAFMGFYSFGYRALSIGLAAELLPTEIRAFGTALATVIGFLGAAASSGAFLPMIRLIHLHGTFLFYGCIGFLAFLFPTLCIPETKGKSLEEIEIETGNGGFFMGIYSKNKPSQSST